MEEERRKILGRTATRMNGMSSACEVHVCILLHSKAEDGVEASERARERGLGVKSAYCKLLCNTALHSNAKRKNAFGNVVVWRGAQ
jgi:hypothetical protein